MYGWPLSGSLNDGVGMCVEYPLGPYPVWACAGSRSVQCWRVASFAVWRAFVSDCCGASIAIKAGLSRLLHYSSQLPCWGYACRVLLLTACSLRRDPFSNDGGRRPQRRPRQAAQKHPSLAATKMARRTCALSCVLCGARGNRQQPGGGAALAGACGGGHLVLLRRPARPQPRRDPLVVPGIPPTPPLFRLLAPYPVGVAGAVRLRAQGCKRWCTPAGAGVNLEARGQDLGSLAASSDPATKELRDGDAAQRWREVETPPVRSCGRQRRRACCG